jgi:hypothetical protein
MNSPLDVFKKLLAAQKKSDPVVITDPKYLETMKKEFGFYRSTGHFAFMKHM